MARRPTGQVVEDPRRPGVFGLRFRAYGQRRYQGLGKTSRGEAEAALRHLLADIERGIWRPPTSPSMTPAPAPVEVPTFHEFASEWFETHKAEWRPNTRVDYAWQLSNHLLPFFAGHRLTEISIKEVDRYRGIKVTEWNVRAEAVARATEALRSSTTDIARATEALRCSTTDAERKRHERELRSAEAEQKRHERELHKARSLPGISPTTINKTITRLGQVLEVAKEYKVIPDNPARGKNRRLKAAKPPAVWIDRPEHAVALLEAAAELDREAPYGRRHVKRRLMLATLLFAGLRLGELTALRWRDVDLAANRITVVESKTDAGTMRTIDLLPTLRDELTEHKAARRPSPNELVFPTSKGKQFGQSNIRRRVLEPAVERANERLAEIDEVPLPEGLTPHKLRHSFASLLVALGEDPGSVMDQMGHTDAAFTLRVYRHGMRRDKASRRAWRDLVGLADRGAPDAEQIGAIGGDSGQPMGSMAALDGLDATALVARGLLKAP